MTPNQFLLKYKSDARTATGAFFESGPIHVAPGDRIGVVLLNLGGPANRRDVEEFLYRRWMDPVVERCRIRRGRHSVIRVAAKIGSRFIHKDYEQIGGQCPINRLTREQARALEEHLNAIGGLSNGIRFTSYVAMRYGNPSSEDALAKMRQDGVSIVVLLPMYPQYSIATTGTSLAYWSTLASHANPQPPATRAVTEYGTHTGYVRAVRDRIDQALQRIPKRLRAGTHVVFAAEQPALTGRRCLEDSFCRQVDETVRLVAAPDRHAHFHVTYFGLEDAGKRTDHVETRHSVRQLAADGVRSVVVVPVGLATDHVWTAYTLDIDLRHEARELGIEFYEVAAAVNCHPQFISALGEIVFDRLHVREQAA